MACLMLLISLIQTWHLSNFHDYLLFRWLTLNHWFPMLTRDDFNRKLLKSWHFVCCRCRCQCHFSIFQFVKQVFIVSAGKWLSSLSTLEFSVRAIRYPNAYKCQLYDRKSDGWQIQCNIQTRHKHTTAPDKCLTNTHFTLDNPKFM